MIQVDRFDAVVALGGIGFDDDGELGADSKQRLDVAADLVLHDRVAPRLITSGARPVTVRRLDPRLILADQMRDRAISRGMDPADVFVDPDSVDTIGNAVFTKQRITEPNGWRRLLIVTSESHLDRSIDIFGHVMGPRYRIQGFSSGEAELPGQRYHEIMGRLAIRAVFQGTDAGDDESIKERLFGIIPGYRQVALPKRVARLARGLV